MSTVRTRTRRPQRRVGKIIAITSAAALAAVGATFSLAAWTDSEWITAGLDGDGAPNLGTSTFEVEQYAYDAASGGLAAGDAEAVFVQEEQSPGNTVTFSVSDISPGVPTYGLVGLRTTGDSISGDLDLQVADNTLTGDPEAALFAATDVRVWTWNEADADPTSETACDSSTAAAGVDLIADGALATVEPAAASVQPLLAEGGDIQFYCFELTFTLPTEAGTDPEDYMGVGLVPAWEFAAESN